MKLWKKALIAVIAAIMIIGIIYAIITIHNANKNESEASGIDLQKISACEDTYCAGYPYAYFNTSSSLCECWDYNNETRKLEVVDSILVQTEEEFNETSGL